MKLGFIGAGNMGSALIQGILEAGTLTADSIYIYDPDAAKTRRFAQENGVHVAKDNQALVEACDIILLAVKPQYAKTVLEECSQSFCADKVLVSIAVGIPISFYKSIVGESIRVVRVMPNTPALVGAGMSILSFCPLVDDKTASLVRELFESVGLVEVLEERLMNEVTALTGSSPAYVFLFIEAMADAAVRSGLPRALSYRMAAQAVLGSAKMALEAGLHPGELKDQVCSPAGTTIEAVQALEKNGFRFAVMDAMDVCTQKAREIGQKFR